MPEKMVLVIFSGTPDRLLGAAVLTSGAVAMDMEVDIYLMLWGVYAFLKKNLEKNKELSEHKELAEELEKGLKNAGLKPWYEMLKEAKELGTVRIHVCSAAAKAWNAKLEDIYLADDFVGAAEIVSTAKEAEIAFFI